MSCSNVQMPWRHWHHATQALRDRSTRIVAAEPAVKSPCGRHSPSVLSRTGTMTNLSLECNRAQRWLKSRVGIDMVKQSARHLSTAVQIWHHMVRDDQRPLDAMCRLKDAGVEWRHWLIKSRRRRVPTTSGVQCSCCRTALCVGCSVQKVVRTATGLRLVGQMNRTRDRGRRRLATRFTDEKRCRDASRHLQKEPECTSRCN